MMKKSKSLSLLLCFTLVAYFVFPIIPSFADPQLPELDKTKTYTNTASIIKDARANIAAGKNFYALALYQYADQVVDAEKEPILKRKILIEKERAQQLVNAQIEREKVQKINDLISKGLNEFRADKLTEAQDLFKQVLAVDPENKEAKNYIEKIIPLRAEEIKDQHLVAMEKQQVRAINDLYIKARIYFKADELEESLKIYQQILDIDLDQSEAQNYVEVVIPREMKNKPERDRLKAERAKKRAQVEEKIKQALLKEADLQNIADRRASKKMATAALEKRRRKAANKPPVPLKDLNAAKVMVNDIKFTGNSIFDEKTLKPVVMPIIGKELSLEELQRAAKQVADFYHDGGYFLAQVVIPEQDIKSQNGTVNMTVLEGRLGEVKVTGTKRFSEKRVRNTLSKVNPSEPVRKQNVERGLMVLNSFSGIKTSSVLQAGKETGTTDINVEVKEQKRVKGSLSIDNTGLESTGKYHISPELAFPNITGRGDEFGLKWMNALDDKHYTTVKPIMRRLYFLKG